MSLCRRPSGDEAVGRRPAAPGTNMIEEATWLRVVDNPSPLLDLGLDAGETAAVLVAESLHADLLLIDERAGPEGRARARSGRARNARSARASEAIGRAPRAQTRP